MSLHRLNIISAQKTGGQIYQFKKFPSGKKQCVFNKNMTLTGIIQKSAICTPVTLTTDKALCT